MEKFSWQNSWVACHDGWVLYGILPWGCLRIGAPANRCRGTITLTQSFDPYGNGLSSQGTASSIYGFDAEQTDATGMVYLRARYYDGGDGRFISRDIWGGNEIQPMSYNNWLYGYGNPIHEVGHTFDNAINLEPRNTIGRYSYLLISASDVKQNHGFFGSQEPNGKYQKPSPIN